jgi:hypothetical protein
MSEWREPKVGGCYRNRWGETFYVERVEPLPAEQGYVVGHWDNGQREELRFSTVNAMDPHNPSSRPKADDGEGPWGGRPGDHSTSPTEDQTSNPHVPICPTCKRPVTDRRDCPDPSHTIPPGLSHNPTSRPKATP